MPVTISGDGGLAGVSNIGFSNMANTGTFTTSGGSAIICPVNNTRSAIFVDNATNRVGINTNTPGQLVHISQPNPIVSISGTANDVELQAGTNGGNAFIGAISNDRLDIRTNNTARITVLADGKVGVNDTNPAVQLVVDKTTVFNENGTVLLSHPIFQVINASDANRGLEIGCPSGGVSAPVYLKVFGTANKFSLINQSNDEQVVVLNSGSVGINIDNPAGYASRCVIQNIASDTRTLSLVSPDSDSARLEFFEGVTGRFALQGLQGATGLQFMNGTTEVARFNNSNLVFPNGQGIDFSAVEGASATSSVLDDYEEGSWTPTVSNGGYAAEVSNFSSRYTKIGRQVFVTAYIQFSGTGTGATLGISGLPYVSQSNSYSVGSVDFGTGGVKGTYCRVEQNSTNVLFLYPSEVVGTQRLQFLGNQTSSTSYVIFSCSYVSAS